MVTWQSYVKAAETMLDSSTIPASEAIITLIKRVNPTTLGLSDTDRERAYALKARLQSLLLENYGETFQLEPHPYDPDIVLIKHQSLPSIDACHADRKRLSTKGLDVVASSLPPPPAKTSARKRGKEKAGCCLAEPQSSPWEALRQAEQLLEEYDYEAAEETLCRLRITDSGELPVLNRAARLLVEEIGACGRAVETLLCQPRQLLKDGELRETLALAYYGNGMLPEARAVLDSFHPGQLSKHALYCYADISMKDGNLSAAYNLLKAADDKDGYLTSFATLAKELEARMLAEAAPFLEQSRQALEAGDRERAECLARRALAVYPSYQEARQLIGRLERASAEDEAARLWELVERAQEGQTRLPLLERLAEICRDDRGRIQELIAAERKREKAAQVEERIASLQCQAEAGAWSDCFESVLWLSRQEEPQDLSQRLNGIRPELAVLFHGLCSQRQSPEVFKESWLTLVRFRAKIASRQYDGCLDMMKEIRPCFGGDARFKEECLLVTEWEQDRAREVVEGSLRQMRREGCSFLEAIRLANALRKRLVILPDGERTGYAEQVQAVVEQLRPRRSEDAVLEEYREALMVGSESRAAVLEGEVGEKSRLAQVKAGVAELFDIVSTPIALTLSADLPIDLAREDAPLGWMIRPRCPGWDNRHVVLREDDHSVVVVDVLEKTATRYRSPNFKDLVFCDSLPARDTFLFRNGEFGPVVWRATLSETQGRFTATFDLIDHFGLSECEYVQHLFISADRPTDYVASVCSLIDDTHSKIVKQNVSIKSGQHLYQVKDELLNHLERISYEPERFAANHAENFTFLDKHLERLCQAYAPFDYCSADLATSHLCMIFDNEIHIVDHKLASIEQVQDVETLFCHLQNILGISISNRLFLLQENSTKLRLYDFGKGRRSVPFNGGRIFCGSLFGRWYYFDYDQPGDHLRLRDVTDELAASVQWEPPFTLPEEDADPKAQAALAEWDKDAAGEPAPQQASRPTLQWKHPPGGRKWYQNLIKEWNEMMS